MVAPRPYLEALDRVLARFPRLQGQCVRTELTLQAAETALAVEAVAAAVAVLVVLPVRLAGSEQGAVSSLPEALGRVEAAVARLARAGRRVCCAYDVEALADLEPAVASAVVELALHQHPDLRGPEEPQPERQPCACGGRREAGAGQA